MTVESAQVREKCSVHTSPAVGHAHRSSCKTADNVSYVKLCIRNQARNSPFAEVVTHPRVKMRFVTIALVIVDAQRNMLEGSEPVPSAVDVKAALSGLLDKARAARAVVVHVQNDGSSGDPDEPGIAGWELVFEPAEDEIVVRKDQSDTFAANPDLAGLLKDRQVERVVIAGMQSEFCIEATSRGAVREGFSVLLPRGAHATYDGETAPQRSQGAWRSFSRQRVWTWSTPPPCVFRLAVSFG